METLVHVWYFQANHVGQDGKNSLFILDLSTLTVQKPKQRREERVILKYDIPHTTG